MLTSRDALLMPLAATLLACKTSADDTAIVPTEGFSHQAVSACDSPLDAVAYEERGAALGLLGGPDPDGEHQQGGAIAVLDIDGDQDLDILTSFRFQNTVIHRWNGESFDTEMLDAPYEPWNMSLGDVNNDGMLDVLVSGMREPMVLLGNGTDFDGMSLPDFPIPDPNTSIAQSFGVIDLDLDGALDVYAVVNTGGAAPTDEDMADFMMWGDGTGSFEVDTSLPSTTARRGFDAVITEWRGQQALYLVNDMGAEFGGDVLMVADGRDIIDVTDEAGTAVAHSGMGGDIADWNEDGRADIYITTSITGHVLWSSQDDDTYFDEATSVGALGIAKENGMGWGAAFVDYDNDGDQDIIDAQGDQWGQNDPDSFRFDQPIWLLEQTEDDIFEEVGGPLGLATTGSYRSALAQDFNNDGVPDLLVSDVLAPPHLYLSKGCTKNGWLQVVAPINSRVEIDVDGKTKVDWSTTHSGYAATHEPIVHFGLGEHEIVDALRVTDPYGNSWEYEHPFQGRRRVIVGSPAGFWD